MGGRRGDGDGAPGAPPASPVSRPGPAIIAHRGGAPGEVENSAAAFRHAIAAGIDMVECDLRRTADGAVVLLHDERIRLGERRVPVARATLAEIRAAHPWALTLDEFLDTFGERTCYNLDVKVPGIERDALAALSARRLTGRALFSTGSVRVLRRLGEATGALGLGLSRGSLVTSVPRPLSGLAAAGMRWGIFPLLWLILPLAPANAVMLQHRIVTPRLVRWLHGQGYRVFAWTVDDPAEAERLARLGVDGIATNDPVWLMGRLRALRHERRRGATETT